MGPYTPPGHMAPRGAPTHRSLQWPPQVASPGPSRRMASASANGSLSMRRHPRRPPSPSPVTRRNPHRSVSHTANSRSMATYCRSTVLLLARERVGFVATSFGLEPTRAGEEPPAFADDAFDTVDRLAPTCFPDTFATTDGPPTHWAAAEPIARPTQQERSKRSVIPSLMGHALARYGSGFGGRSGLTRNVPTFGSPGVAGWARWTVGSGWRRPTQPDLEESGDCPANRAYRARRRHPNRTT